MKQLYHTNQPDLSAAIRLALLLPVLYIVCVFLSFFLLHIYSP